MKNLPDSLFRLTSPSARRVLLTALVIAATAAPASLVSGSLWAGSLWPMGPSTGQGSDDAEDSAADPDDDDAETPLSKEKEYRRYMRRGDRKAVEAGRIRIERALGRPRRARAYGAVVDDAVRLYRRASEIKPDAAEPHYRAAEVLYAHKLDTTLSSGHLRRRTVADQILEHWNAFEKLAPLDPRFMPLGNAPYSILDRRAILYTRLGTKADIERAILDYEAMMARSPKVNHRWLGNLAESYMMVGRLDDAIATYRRALEYSQDPLHGYGLAVALDRDGQGEQARQIMWTFASVDKLHSLGKGGVFFVPREELFYYLGLGHDALGNPAQAVTNYRVFIESGIYPQYQARARENLAAAEKRAARSKKKPPVVPRGLRF